MIKKNCRYFGDELQAEQFLINAFLSFIMNLLYILYKFAIFVKNYIIL